MRGLGSGSSSATGRGGGGRAARGRGRGGGGPVEAPDVGTQQPGDIPMDAPEQPAPVEPPAVVLDAQGRTRCVPDAKREKLLESGRVSRSMREIFRKKWFENGIAWQFLTTEQVDYYWEEFKKYYWWDEAYSEGVIKHVFILHARERYKDVLTKMKKSGQKHASVGEEIWAAWKAIWDTEESKKKSDIARANRMSEAAGPGSGPVRHSCGSRSALKHMDVLSQELGRQPTAPELYRRTHSSKADKNVMIDKRSRDMIDTFTQRLAESSQPPPTEDGSSIGTANVDETDLFLDIEGVNKKRRVYGLGSASSSYVDTAACSRARSSSSRSAYMPEEEIDRRVQAGIQTGIQEGIRQAMADIQATNAQHMAELLRTELAKLMPTLPPPFQPSRDHPGDDDTSAE